MNENNFRRRSTGGLIALTGVSSVLTAAGEYAVYIGLVEIFGVLYLYSSVAASGFGILLNFTLNKWWVFRHAAGRAMPQFVRYVIVTGIGIGLGLAGLYLLVDVVGIPYWIGWAIANLSVFSVWTYPTNRYLVFPDVPVPAERPAID
jgi:putative flippase GtrA